MQINQSIVVQSADHLKNTFNFHIFSIYEKLNELSTLKSKLDENMIF